MPEDYSIARIEDVETEEAPRSGTTFASLTDELDCTEIAIRIWFLEPGDSITYHRETAQEELYYLISGPGQMHIEGERINVPERTVVRVPPETARKVLNDTSETEHEWLIAGAPKSKSEAEYIDL
jgi:quercetin dioxygenase-like cupin family protein